MILNCSKSYNRLQFFTNLTKKVCRLLLLVLILKLSSHQLVAQIDKKEYTPLKEYKPNSIYGELLGNGLSISINYERIIKQKENKFFSIRIGYSKLKEGFLGQNQNEYNFIPIECIWFNGKKHHFEYGFGVTTLLEDYYYYENGRIVGREFRYGFIPIPRIGYRYQAPNSHFLLRVGLALLISGGTRPAIPFPSFGSGIAF